MDPLNLLKANFAENLEKQGSSLEELENALQAMHTEAGVTKAASLLKLAFLDKLNPLDIGAKAGGAYAGTLALGGYGMATGYEHLDKDISEKNKKLKTYQDKINLLKKLTNKINQEHES